MTTAIALSLIGISVMCLWKLDSNAIERKLLWQRRRMKDLEDTIDFWRNEATIAKNALAVEHEIVCELAMERMERMEREYVSLDAPTHPPIAMYIN